MSNPENPSSASWTYRMEVSPTGQSSSNAVQGPNDPAALLQHLVSLQSQTLDVLRQNLEIDRLNLDLNRQNLDLTREIVQVNREQRARQMAELERWQHGHQRVLDASREALGRLEQVHASLIGEMAEYVEDNHENLIDGDFALSDFVDRFGPRLAHLNTMLAVLRPLAVVRPKPED